MKKATDLLNRFIEKAALPIVLLAVLGLNASLLFDHVLWGDEAFSMTVIRGTDFAGILERNYYWDSHPPLYYLYLKLYEPVLGNHIWVGHLASFLPFAACALLAVTLWKKKTGTWPVLFFLVLTGFSETCCQYNMEVRMYAALFFDMFVCLWFVTEIFDKPGKKGPWAGLTVFGVLAAYTHYYGLIASSLLLFFTALFYFLREKGSTWKYGTVAIPAYIILYAPWLRTFLKQAGDVKQSWWATEPEHLNIILEFIFLGRRLKYILLPLCLILLILVILTETGKIGPHKGEKKPLGNTLWTLITCWTTFVVVIALAYLVCYVYQPILARRYMYSIVPIMLVCLMLELSYLISAYKDCFGETKLNLLLCVLFLVILIPSLLDFKYFRSVTKTEEAETQVLLQAVGEPKEDTVFLSQNVKHLAWTVLQYYYPDNHIGQENLDFAVSEGASDIWGYYGSQLDEGWLNYMDENGYTTACYPGSNFGKYPCCVYHFYKE